MTHTTKNEHLCIVATPIGADAGAESDGSGSGRMTQTQWLTWRHQRRLALQRERRAASRRFDFYADRDVARALEGLWKPLPGHTFSELINDLIRRGLNVPPVFFTGE
jgi:hypothetical protein